MRQLQKLNSNFRKAFILISTLTIGTSGTSICSAEYNLATKEEECILISTTREIGLGRSIAKKIEEEYELCKNAKMQEKISSIGENLASVCDRKDTTYFFTILEGEETNAFALPGGYVYVFKKTIELTESDDEIAAILAHEIGHIAARHSVKRLQASLGYTLLSVLALVASRDARFKRGTDIALSQLTLGYSRDDELLADKLAVKYMKKAGYNPEAIISLLEKLDQLETNAPIRPLVASYMRTHPYLPERIAAVRREIYGTMEFTDYINRPSYYSNISR